MGWGFFVAGGFWFVCQGFFGLECAYELGGVRTKVPVITVAAAAIGLSTPAKGTTSLG